MSRLPNEDVHQYASRQCADLRDQAIQCFLNEKAREPRCRDLYKQWVICKNKWLSIGYRTPRS